MAVIIIYIYIYIYIGVCDIVIQLCVMHPLLNVAAGSCKYICDTGRQQVTEFAYNYVAEIFSRHVNMYRLSKS